MKLRAATLALLACVLLAACSRDVDPSELSVADQARADSLIHDYESARLGQNWEAAERQADLLRERYPDSEAAQKMGATIVLVREQASAAREAQRLGGLWEYQQVPAAGGVQRSAAIYSRTVRVEEGEIAPVPDARLVLREHPEWGRSAYLLLEQSRFRCGRPCRMHIAFDDAPAQSFAGKQADSGSGPALFINEERRFIEALQGSTAVRITLPPDSGSVSSLTFEVAGFEPPRYANPGPRPPR